MECYDGYWNQVETKKQAKSVALGFQSPGVTVMSKQVFSSFSSVGESVRPRVGKIRLKSTTSGIVGHCVRSK